MQKVLVVCSTNLTPEKEINKRLAKLGEGWKVVSAHTSAFPFGVHEETRWLGQPLHIVMVTTVVVENTSSHH